MSYKMKGFPNHKGASPLKQDLYFDLMSMEGANALTNAIIEENIEGEVSKELAKTHEGYLRTAYDQVLGEGAWDYRNGIIKGKQVVDATSGANHSKETWKKISNIYIGLRDGTSAEDSGYVPEDE